MREPRSNIDTLITWTPFQTYIAVNDAKCLEHTAVGWKSCHDIEKPSIRNGVHPRKLESATVGGEE